MRAVILALLGLMLISAPAYADTDVGFGDTTTTFTKVQTSDPDYTGIGVGVTMPAAQFDGTTWGRSVRNNAPNPCVGGSTSDPVSQSCRWFYPNYAQNCLSSSTPDAAIQVLWVYKEGRDPATLWHRLNTTNLQQLRQVLRGTSSVFAANSEQDLIDSSGNALATKGQSRELRFITGMPTTGACAISIVDVPVPATVLKRSVIQTKAYGNTAYGLFPWLLDNGFAQANRDYFVLDDHTSDTTSHCLTTSPGAETAAPSLPNMLWGPYGNGQPSDLYEVNSDPDGSMPNWGGAFVDFCVTNTYMSQATDVNHTKSSLFVRTAAHELTHLLGVDPDAPGYIPGEGGHQGSGWDVMSNAQQGAYCNNVAMSYTRPDCNNNHYWSLTSYQKQQNWYNNRWSASENAFLWGGPKPDEYTLFDLRQIPFDFCANGPQWQCFD